MNISKYLCNDLLIYLSLRLTDQDLLSLCKIIPKLYQIPDLWSIRFRKIFGKTQIPKTNWFIYYASVRHIIIEVCWADIKLDQGKLSLSAEDLSDIAYFTGRSANLDVVNFVTDLYPSKDVLEKIIEGAARTGRIDIIQYLYTDECNLDKALSNASAGAHYDVISYLVDKGANNWELALIGSAESGDHSLFDLFLEKVEVNKIILNLCLLGAVRKDDIKLVIRISDLGADDWDEGLSEAILFEKLELIEWFIQKGAKNFQDALYWAEFSETPNYLEKVMSLLHI